MVNENVLVGAGVTLAGMVLAAFVFLFLKVLQHLESRLLTWREMSKDKVRVAETTVQVAQLRYGPKVFDLPLPPYPKENRG